jgi:hypothetical protein
MTETSRTRRAAVRLLALGGSLVLALVGAELVFRAINRRSGRNPDIKEQFDCRARDPSLGSALKPSCDAQWKRFVNGRLVFDAHLSTDRYGRRNIPVPPSAARTNLALFFGCSFTLGAGLNDDETLPYYVARRAASYQVHNFGGSGYGPQHMLARLTDEPAIEAQLERTGQDRLLIYVFPGFHVRRAVGAGGFGPNFPFYDLDASGALVRKGTFASARPIRTGLFSLLGHTELFHYFDGRFYPSDRDVAVTVQIIEASLKAFQKKFGSDRFYVVIYPDSREVAARVIPLFEARGIKYLDYSRLFSLRDPGLAIPGEGHPTAAANRILSERLLADIPGLAVPPPGMLSGGR